MLKIEGSAPRSGNRFTANFNAIGNGKMGADVSFANPASREDVLHVKSIVDAIAAALSGGMVEGLLPEAFPTLEELRAARDKHFGIKIN